MKNSSQLPLSGFLKQEIARLESVFSAQKTKAFANHEYVLYFFERHPKLKKDFEKFSPEDQHLLLSLVFIGQGDLAFHGCSSLDPEAIDVKTMVGQLRDIDTFYDFLGGIVGYHLTFLKLIHERHHVFPSATCQYAKPEGVDLTQKNARVRRTLFEGIRSLPQIAEIYPVGGAGDRLQLRDEEDNTLLPAACLLFQGISLLEGMIHDLQAREFLYYKLFGESLCTPVIMMTSHEKNNHEKILEICQKHQWFGRDPASYFFLIQPLAPMITQEGRWAFSAPLHLLLKPGGHGVIWKLCKDAGGFDWLKQRGCRAALIRQINNPLAGTDGGLLALAGWGIEKKKAFGFASCERRVNTAEGMNVLIEKKTEQGFEYTISNVEYTEFAKRGIADQPVAPGSSYSMFPANTNILFANLESVEQAIPQCPLPGMLVNMKNAASILNANGQLEITHCGRLESTMQNIADVMTTSFPQPIQSGQQQDLKTFVTYNKREKTISVTKRSYVPGKEVLETPESCFYDLQHNMRELLVRECGFSVPEIGTMEEMLEKGPNFLVTFHPALGPLYSIISQKIRKGTLAQGAELQLFLSELSLENLYLEGSLRVEAQSPCGYSVGTYSEYGGKCHLKNVKIINRGIDRRAQNVYWKQAIVRHEEMSIFLEGSGEFFAEDVIFEGPQTFFVPDGRRLIVTSRGGVPHFKIERSSAPTGFWKYEVGADFQIHLVRK